MHMAAADPYAFDRLRPPEDQRCDVARALGGAANIVGMIAANATNPNAVAMYRRPSGDLARWF